jgi:uncharacterized protein
MIGTILLWVLAVIGGLYLLAVVAMFFYQGRLIYVPNRVVWRTPTDAGLPHEEVFLNAADGVHLHAWFIQHPEDRGTVLFFHGNAGNIAHWLDTAQMLWEWGLSTLLIDYRGYGNSGGKPSAHGTSLDADAAWKFLVEEKGLPPEKIVLFGRSLGAAVAADLAARVQPAGVILDSGFTSLPDVGAQLYPWLPVRLLSRHRYPTEENVTRFRCPVLVAHSREDDLIPFSHGERVFQAAVEPKFFLEMVGNHRECVTTTGIPYQRAIKSFILEALSFRPQSDQGNLGTAV